MACDVSSFLFVVYCSVSIIVHISIRSYCLVFHRKNIIIGTYYKRKYYTKKERKKWCMALSNYVFVIRYDYGCWRRRRLGCSSLHLSALVSKSSTVQLRLPDHKNQLPLLLSKSSKNNNPNEFLQYKNVGKNDASISIRYHGPSINTD